MYYSQPRGRAPSPLPEFEIERVPSSSAEFGDYVLQLLEATNAPFTVSGRVKLESAPLILFFRTKDGITHSVDFPIDVDYSLPPSLQVLIAACRPHVSADPITPSLVFPSELPLNFSLDVANHPILDAVHTALFPNLPPGNHLSTLKHKLEIVDARSRLGPQHPPAPHDARSATIIVTLPSRFEGGALLVRNCSNAAESYIGRGTTIDEIEWTAFLPDCTYEIEPVQRGCRISISYAVFVRSFSADAPANPRPEPLPLIRPSDAYLDRLGSVLNLSRARTIAFHLEFDYALNPAESLADSVVPLLRGGDSLLYHAIKLYKLSPEFRWTAGGYIWPVDRSVDVLSHNIQADDPHPLWTLPDAHVPPLRGPFSSFNTDAPSLRARVQDSGAVPLADANITLLTSNPLAASALTTVVPGKERVYLVSNGRLEKLVVNILLVAFVP